MGQGHSWILRPRDPVRRAQLSYAPWVTSRSLRKALSSAGAAVTVAAAGGAVQSCYGATEIRLALSTNADCRQHTQTQVRLGNSGEPVAVRDGVCNGAENPNLGTLTLVPSGDRDGTVFVKVVAALTSYGIKSLWLSGISIRINSRMALRRNCAAGMGCVPGGIRIGTCRVR